jgi:Helicase HerA, central domain
MAQVLASLHAASGRSSFSLEYGRHADTAGVYCRLRGRLAKLAEKQLVAAYPDLSIERLQETLLAPRAGKRREAELWLAPDVLPIETSDAFEDRLSRELNDPLAALLGVLAAGPDTSVWSHVAIELKPASQRRVATARRLLDRYYRTPLYGRRRQASRFLAGATSPQRVRRIGTQILARMRYGKPTALPPIESKAAYAKLDQPLFTARIRLTVVADSEAAAQRQLEQITAAFAPYTLNSDSAFRVIRGSNSRGSLLSVDELAILFHPATATVRTERLQQNLSRTFEPPAVLPAADESDTVTLGMSNFRRRHEVVALRADDRRRHLYVVGKTGTGKSTLLLNLVVDDIQKGRGVGVIDPHGDLVADVLKRIPRARTNDFILFDPADHPIAFNPLACSRPEQRPLVASSVLSAMKKVFAIDETNAPRMLYILRNALLALVEQPQCTLFDVPRLLADAAFRRQVVSRLSDELVRAFWRDEFAGWHDRYRIEAIAPIQNKVGQFLSSPLLRPVFASPKSALDLRHVMDTGKILLVNLSHGRLGEDSAALLGALLVTSIEQAAKARADVPEDERKDFYLYADEFQTYAGTESLAIVLSQARKYRLSLCLANQLVEQMMPELAATVFGNVGSLCVMQVGHRDAERLAEELGDNVEAHDLTALPKYHAVLRMLIDGTSTRPFTIRTLPPPRVTGRHAAVQTLIRVSTQRHAPALR